MRRIRFHGSRLGITFTIALVIILIVLSASGCGITVPASSKPAGNSKLLFSYKGKIFSIGEENNSLTKLSGDEVKAIEDYPRWSPDRRTIAFIRYIRNTEATSEGGVGKYSNVDGEIWLMDSSGNNRTKLADVLNRKNLNLQYFEWASDGKGLICAELAPSYLLYETFLTHKRTKINDSSLSSIGRPREVTVSPLSQQIALLFLQITSVELQNLASSSFSNNTIGDPVMVLSSSTDLGLSRISAPSIRWLTKEELIFPELEQAPVVSRPGTAAPVQCRLWKLNVSSGEKALLFQGAQGEIIGCLSVSPDRAKVSFLSYQQNPNAEQFSNDWAEDKAPRPSILDLQTGKVTRITLPTFDGNEPVESLNWSSP